MQLNLTKILFIITLFFVSILITRFIAKILLNFFDNKVKKKNSDDPGYFDKLVGRETQRLRSRAGLSPILKKPNKQKNKKANFQIDHIYKSSKLLEKEIEEIIDLFKKIEWGGNDKILTFQKKFVEMTNYLFSIEEIISTITFIKRKDLLFIIPNYYPNLNQIRELILNILTINHLVLFINNKSNYFADQFSTKKKVSLPLLKKSFISFLLNAKDYKHEEIIDSILKNKYKLSDCNLEQKCVRYLFNYSKTSLLSHFELSLKILNDVILFKMITPISLFNEKSKNNTKIACKLLEISSIPKNEALLKKSYRSIVMKKHPDQMNRYKIPECYKNTVTANFQQIQLAYDFLSKKF